MSTPEQPQNPPASQPQYSQQQYPQQSYQQTYQQPVYPEYVKRPWNITLVAIISLLIGILDVVAGIALLLLRNNGQYQDALGLNAINMATYGGVILVVGAIVILVSFGLFGGSRLARGVIAFFAVLRIALSVVGLILSNHSSIFGSFVGEIVFAIILLLLLYAGNRTRLFFAQ